MHSLEKSSRMSEYLACLLLMFAVNIEVALGLVLEGKNMKEECGKQQSNGPMVYLYLIFGKVLLHRTTVKQKNKPS